MFIKCSRSELTVHRVRPSDIMMVTSALVTPHPDNLKLFGFVASDKASCQHHRLSSKFNPKKPILPHLIHFVNFDKLKAKA